MNKFNDAAGHTFSAGRVRIVDQNGDYVINANDDRVIIGYRRPNWTGGLTNTFSYKGFELMVQMYGRWGKDYYTNGASVGLTGFFTHRKVDYYTEINKDAAYHKPQYDAAGITADPYNGATNYSKASFINIRNISLAYRVPRNIISNWGSMQSLRIYAQCINPGALYSACDFKNMDLNSSQWNRNFVFGINVGF
jgi:hypothetical protein